MQQFNLLVQFEKSWFRIWMFIPVLFLEYGVQLFSNTSYSYSKDQYKHYQEFVSLHEIFKSEPIKSLEFLLISKHLNQLIALVPCHMRLEKMVIQAQRIWLSGYVMQHEIFNEFWKQIKRFLPVKQIYLIDMTHSGQQAEQYPWKFAMKIDF